MYKSAELPLSTCPALKNSVLPVLVVVETFTDDEPAVMSFNVRKERGREGERWKLTVVVRPSNPLTGYIIHDNLIFQNKICRNDDICQSRGKLNRETERHEKNQHENFLLMPPFSNKINDP